MNLVILLLPRTEVVTSPEHMNSMICIYVTSELNCPCELFQSVLSNQSIMEKRQRSYTREFKLKVLEFYSLNSLSETSKKFGIDKKNNSEVESS